MNIPPAGAIRLQTCPLCQREFAVCRADVLRPDIVMPGAYPPECPDCMDYQVEDFPELKRTLKEHRAHMHAFALQFNAACG